MLAVEMGLHFEPNDLSVCLNRFRAGYWFGEDMEDFYRRAVLYRNAGAYQCFEAYTGRKPFIWPDVKVHHHYGGGKMGFGISRLVVGAEFVWSSERVMVTSFNDERQVMTVCSYTRTEGEDCPQCSGMVKYPEVKLLHRCTITHAMLATEKKKLREAAKAKDEVAA